MSHISDEADTLALLEAERDYHNRAYAKTTPFSLGKRIFTKEDVWQKLRPMYVKGGDVRGRRTRRMFELMELDGMRGRRIVDIGCGDGSAAVFMAMYGAQVTGLDISEVGIAEAKKTAEVNGVAENCDFLVRTASETGLPTGSVDAIVFKSVLHHLLKYPGVDIETWRILKPGGKIFFADIVRDNKLYNFFKSIYISLGAETDMGEDVTMADYHRFAERYENFHYERFSLVEGIKRVVPARARDTAPARLFVYLAEKADDLLIGLAPGLEKYTLEIVGTMTKPMSATGD